MQVQGTQCAKGSTQIHLIFLDLHQTATDPLWTATDQPWTLNPFPFRLARARARVFRARPDQDTWDHFKIPDCDPGPPEGTKKWVTTVENVLWQQKRDRVRPSERIITGDQVGFLEIESWM